MSVAVSDCHSYVIGQKIDQITEFSKIHNLPNQMKILVYYY